jgi:hypothetical protein
MASIITAAPQFLVDELDRSLSFYEERVGSLAACAPKLPAERDHRRSEEHLDAYLVVSGVEERRRAFMHRYVHPTERLPPRPQW